MRELIERLEEAKRIKKLRVDPDVRKLRSGSVPKEITLYGGKPHTVDKKVWKIILKQAAEDKQWAEEHEFASNPEEWPASGISVDMLKSRLAKSVEQLALESYKYKYHRAHAKGSLWGSPAAIDPAAKRDWEKWSGKEIKIEGVEELDEGFKQSMDVIADMIGRDTIRKAGKKAGNDMQTRTLVKNVAIEMANRLSKVVDQDFITAANQIRMASAQSDPASVRNLVFKAANTLGMKLPSGSF